MTLEEFREKALRESNKKRQVHNAPPLSLDVELNNAAQAFARELAKAKKFEHSDPSSRPNQGENLFQECLSHGRRAIYQYRINRTVLHTRD